MNDLTPAQADALLRWIMECNDTPLQLPIGSNPTPMTLEEPAMTTITSPIQITTGTNTVPDSTYPDAYRAFSNWSYREEYERDLRRRQAEHLEAVRNRVPWQPCLHDSCPDCCGTGIKRTGGSCIHGISCPCPKCSPWC